MRNIYMLLFIDNCIDGLTHECTHQTTRLCGIMLCTQVNRDDRILQRDGK